MNRIKVLTPDIYNKIAAGEVIENPASVIKELVENSIDAGANKLTIEIENGGLKSIVVSDNGCGIPAEDIDVAFLKHATSKITHYDDLLATDSLGFRGEALASIAAVADVKLTTRTNSAEIGITATTKDGAIVSKQPCSCNVGTTMEVTDLFANVPARLKFLKSPSRETTEITKCVHKLVLTSPYLQLTYVVDGKNELQTTGEGLDSALFAVYGADCVKNMMPINVEEHGLRVTGYACTPSYAKSNSTYQTLSVNGRYITDKQISGAISGLYKNYLMKHQFPFYVLNIDLPFDEVDVNVHPRKTEVRFHQPDKICGVIYRAIERQLIAYKANAINRLLNIQDKISDDVVLINENKAYQNADLMKYDRKKDVLEIEQRTFEVSQREDFVSLTMEAERDMEELVRRKKAEKEPESDWITIDTGYTAEQIEAEGKHDRYVESHSVGGVQLTLYDQKFGEEDHILDRARILGSAFKTYLILEIEDKIVLVDQHAAHERILFEKFMALRGKNVPMQSVLVPYVFNVSDTEAQYINDNLVTFKEGGIGIEPFGPNQFRITEVSVLFLDAKLKDLAEYVTSGIDDYNSAESNQLVVEKIAQQACKAAVKAGDILDEMEIEYILDCVLRDKVIQCPHGRPIFIIIPKSQLEKMFKRTI